MTIPFSAMALLLLALLPMASKAQEKRVLLAVPGQASEAHLTWRIVDAKTKAPLSGATIGQGRDGATAGSDETGYFQLFGFTNQLDDSLSVSKPGYFTRLVSIESGTTGQRVVELVEMTAAEKNTHAPRGTTCGFGPRVEALPMSPGLEHALFIVNKTKKRLGYIRAVSFFIGEKGVPSQLFRVHFYRADGPRKAPLTEVRSQLGTVDVYSAQQDEWHTIDLRRHAILMPPGGFYIGLEWMPADPQPAPLVQGYQPSGQILRPKTQLRNSQRNYSKDRSANWIKSASTGFYRYYHTVKADLEIL